MLTFQHDVDIFGGQKTWLPEVLSFLFVYVYCSLRLTDFLMQDLCNIFWPLWAVACVAFAHSLMGKGFEVLFGN